MAVKPIPDGYHSVTPYLILDDAARALEFYKKAFGAVELLRMPAPGGKIGHAEIRIGDSPIMLADEAPAMGARSARTIGGSPISLMVYVEDVDARGRAGGRRRREAHAAGRQPVLRRPHRRHRRSVRLSLVPRHARRGRPAGRARKARGEGDGGGTGSA